MSHWKIQFVKTAIENLTCENSNTKFNYKCNNIAIRFVLYLMCAILFCLYVFIPIGAVSMNQTRTYEFVIDDIWPIWMLCKSLT